MKELLQSLGFTMKSSCSCGGTYQEKWRKGTTLVVIYPKRNTFFIQQNGATTVKTTKADELQTKLNEIL